MGRVCLIVLLGLTDQTVSRMTRWDDTAETLIIIWQTDSLLATGLRAVAPANINLDYINQTPHYLLSSTSLTHTINYQLITVFSQIYSECK